jgi:transposase InsO family protein
LSTRRNTSIPWQHPRFKVGRIGGMAYTKNPYLSKVRANAVRLVTQQGWGVRQTARYIGVYPSTVSKWVKKAGGTDTTTLETESSRPRYHPRTVDTIIVNRIVELRKKLGRCSDVIHAYLKREDIQVSLSTVYRTLKRKGLVNERSKHKKYHWSGERPKAEKPGILVQTDTIHVYLSPKRRMYIFTLIDVYSRWAYAQASTKLNARIAFEFISQAKEQASFSFDCIQSDHGPEFASTFTDAVQASGIRHRHSRVRKPNDNAHVERFNRTIQEDLKFDIIKYKKNIPMLNIKIDQYIHYYNYNRLHMGLDFHTPNEVLPSL